MKKTTLTSPLDAILKNVPGSDELHYRMFSLCEMYSGKHFCLYHRYLNFQWLPLTKYTVAAVATVAEIEIFLSQRLFDDIGDSSDGSDYMETGLNETRKK